jgi:hypothetical protein
MSTRCTLVLSALTAALVSVSPLSSHETDNLVLPLNREFADLGSFLDTVHANAIQSAVQGLNRQIEQALQVDNQAERASRLRRLHDPDTLAAAVFTSFSDAFTEVLDIEDAVRGSWARKMYPGQITAHWSLDWMYSYLHFPLDPRRIVLLFQSSTIKAYGVYFGTDKLSHFHHMGRYYYENYRIMLTQGMTPEAATAAILKTYSTDGPLSESGLLGFVATGVYSNADLVSNYMGFKFLLNLSEPVMLKGVVHPPLVDRCGVFWSVNARVRPESGWFGAFISDHWNEALNPNLYGPMLRGGARAYMRDRADWIMEFYTKRDGRPDSALYYARMRDESSTYYGEDYGYAGESEEILTLGNTCIPAIAAKVNQEAKRVAQTR